jgi:hypothetical protein
MSDTTAELALKTAVDADDAADYLTIDLRNSLNTVDGLFNSSTGHNHNGAHQGGNLVFGVLNTTSIAFANGATLGPFATGNQLRFQSTNVSFSGTLTVDGTSSQAGAATFGSTVGVTGLLTASGGVQGGGGAFTTLTASGAAILSSSLSVGGTTTVAALNSSGTITAAALSAADVYATTGWHRNSTAGTGLFNQALNVGLRFDSGRAGPIMHGGSYDGARVHGTPHVRVGYFTTPVVANAAEATITVPFSPAFPGGASPTVMLTLLRNTADHMQWRIGLEFGASGGSTGFTARVRNEIGNAESVSVAYLAYWNE